MYYEHDDEEGNGEPDLETRLLTFVQDALARLDREDNNNSADEATIRDQVKRVLLPTLFDAAKQTDGEDEQAGHGQAGQAGQAGHEGLVLFVNEQAWVQRHHTAVARALNDALRFGSESTTELAVLYDMVLARIKREQLLQAQKAQEEADDDDDDDDDEDDDGEEDRFLLMDGLNEDAAVVTHLVQHIWDKPSSERHYLGAVRLLCAIALNAVLVDDAFEKLDKLFVSFLFDQVEQTNSTSSEALNIALTKLLVRCRLCCSLSI